MSYLLPYSEDLIRPIIHFIRNENVILDRDVAALYGIETKRLKEAVRRNLSRFPPDFMFELSDEEFQNWRSQFASSNSNGDKMGLRYAPMAFTEHLTNSRQKKKKNHEPLFGLKNEIRK